MSSVSNKPFTFYFGDTVASQGQLLQFVAGIQPLYLRNLVILEACPLKH